MFVREGKRSRSAHRRDQRRPRRTRPNVSRLCLLFGLAVLANAAVLGWTSGGGAQDDSDDPAPAPAATCRAFDLWESSGFSPAFAGPVATALDGVDLPSAVQVSVNGLANESLNETNQALAAATLMAYLEDACADVVREDSVADDVDSGDADTEHDDGAAATPEPTPKPTPEQTMSEQPEPTPIPQSEFKATLSDGGGPVTADGAGGGELPATGSNFTMMLTMVGLTFVAIGAMLRAQHAPAVAVPSRPAMQAKRRSLDLASPPVVRGLLGWMAMSIAVWSLFELLF